MQINLGNPVNRSHPLNRGRMGWWLGLPNNGGGGRYFDLIGTDHGIIRNSPSWLPDKSGLLLQSASSHWVELASATITYPISVACWYRRVSNGSGYPAIIGWGREGSGADGFGLFQATDGTNCLYTECFDSASDKQVYPGPDLSDNKWHRCVATCDGADLKLYMDGTLRGTASGASGTNAPVESLTMGQRARGLSIFLDGSVKDGSWWNRVLTAEEVAYDHRISSQGYRCGDSPLNWYSRPAIYSPSAAAASRVHVFHLGI